MKTFLIIFGICLGVILLTLILIIVFITHHIRKIAFGKRFDDNQTLHYFSAEELGMHCSHVPFTSGNVLLQGYFYSKEVTKLPIIILSHGLGAGHIQYMKEIDYFTTNGYRVFTYDTRGCLNSKGKGIFYLSNAVKDLNAAVLTVETSRYHQYPILLYGHSMGAYCVNCMRRFYHRNVIGAVSLSSFESPRVLMEDMLTPKMGKWGPFFAKMLEIGDWLHSPYVGRLEASDCLEDVYYPCLEIFGEKDPIVPLEHSYQIDLEIVDANNDVHYEVVKDRYHRPNISKAAAEYDQKVSQDISKFYQEHPQPTKEQMREFYDSIDYNLLVEFDDEIMSKILNFYNSIPCRMRINF